MRVLDNTIRLSGLRFYAYHGVEPQERIVGAWYTVDLIIKVKGTDIGMSDELSSTVNYASVAETVKAEMEIPSDLLEHVAWRIADSVMKRFDKVDYFQVSITKQNPPVCAPCTGAGYILTVGR